MIYCLSALQNAAWSLSFNIWEIYRNVCSLIFKVESPSIIMLCLSLLISLLAAGVTFKCNKLPSPVFISKLYVDTAFLLFQFLKQHDSALNYRSLDNFKYTFSMKPAYRCCQRNLNYTARSAQVACVGCKCPLVQTLCVAALHKLSVFSTSCSSCAAHRLCNCSQ